MLNFKVVFFSFYFFLTNCLSAIDLGGDSILNKNFQAKLKKFKIYEPNVHVLLFDNNVILIGSINNFSNLDNILHLAKKMLSLVNKTKRPCNLLIYKFAPENDRLKKFVEGALRKNKAIRLNNYMIFTMGDFVWVIGYARNNYEKDMVKSTLSLLKARKTMKNFYCFISFKKNYSKGFIYRHKV